MEINRRPVDVDQLFQRLGASGAVVQGLIEAFAQQLPQDVANIEEALKQSETKNVKSLAHALKGSAAMISAGPLNRVAAELEGVAAEGNLQSVDEQLEKLTAEMARFLEWSEQSMPEEIGSRASNN